MERSIVIEIWGQSFVFGSLSQSLSIKLSGFVSLNIALFPLHSTTRGLPASNSSLCKMVDWNSPEEMGRNARSQR